MTDQTFRASIADVPIILIDEVVGRRAALSFMLAEAGVHVEPFENVAELGLSWPVGAAVLIFDDPASISHLVGKMAQDSHWLPIIAYAPDPTPHQVADAILGGAIDYLSYPVSGEEAVAAIIGAEARATARQKAKKRVIRTESGSRLANLTKRECQVLGGLVEGLSNRLIARKLGISGRTVELHRAHLLEKIGAHNTAEAVRIALEAMFTPPGVPMSIHPVGSAATSSVLNEV